MGKKHQIPTSKLQRNFKLQAPRTRTRTRTRAIKVTIKIKIGARDGGFNHGWTRVKKIRNQKFKIRNPGDNHGWTRVQKIRMTNDDAGWVMRDGAREGMGSGVLGLGSG